MVIIKWRDLAPSLKMTSRKIESSRPMWALGKVKLVQGCVGIMQEELGVGVDMIKIHCVHP